MNLFFFLNKAHMNIFSFSPTKVEKLIHIYRYLVRVFQCLCPRPAWCSQSWSQLLAPSCVAARTVSLWKEADLVGCLGLTLRPILGTLPSLGFFCFDAPSHDFQKGSWHRVLGPEEGADSGAEQRGESLVFWIQVVLFEPAQSGANLLRRHFFPLCCRPLCYLVVPPTTVLRGRLLYLRMENEMHVRSGKQTKDLLLLKLAEETETWVKTKSRRLAKC